MVMVVLYYLTVILVIFGVLFVMPAQSKGALWLTLMMTTSYKLTYYICSLQTLS